MEKTFVTLFLIFASFLFSYGQVKEGNNFEVGGIYSFAFSQASNGTNYNISGPGAYFEYRYEFDPRIHVGVRFDYRYANGPGHEYDEAGIRYETNYNQFCLKGLCGYTFCAEKVVSPFVGIGIGGGLLYTHRMDNKNFINYSYVLTPRVGVQIKRFRLTCDLDLLGNSYYKRSIGYSSFSKRVISIHTTVVSLNLGFQF